MARWRRLDAVARRLRATALPPILAISAAVLSIALTAVAIALGAQPGPEVWVLAEPVLLTALAYPASRWSSTLVAAGSVAALCLALALMMFRFLDAPWSAGAVWAAPALVVASVARYQNGQERRHELDVAHARREQRLELAHDLHDFATHDVSEVVAQAQAGRMVYATGDPRVVALLERIERAGLGALASMDRTVGLLRESADADFAPIGGTADVAGLVDRFNEAGSPVASLEERLPNPVGREAGSVAYRLVAEALTNVRRHAADATEVRVVLRGAGGTLNVAVADDGRAPRSILQSRATQGLGLPGLDARVGALGGTLRAGPQDDGGWRIEARLPSHDFDSEGRAT